MPAWIGPALAAAGSFASSMATNIWNAREARENRRFQERMSSTAHQREVADLRAANINPALRGLGGASAPSGSMAMAEDSGSKAIHSALAVRKMKADIDLVQSQAALTRTQAADISSTLPQRTELMSMQADLARMSASQIREVIPQALAKAIEEVKLTASSARAATATAVLNEAAAAGASNLEAFEKSIGEAGPWVKFFFQALKAVKAAGAKR